MDEYYLKAIEAYRSESEKLLKAKGFDIEKSFIPQPCESSIICSKGYIYLYGNGGYLGKYNLKRENFTLQGEKEIVEHVNKH